MVTSKDLIEFDVSVLGTQKLPWVRREPKYWRAMKRIKAKTRGRKNNLITLIVTYFYSVHEINLGLRTSDQIKIFSIIHHNRKILFWKVTVAKLIQIS